MRGRVLGHYRLLDLVGAGGMGEVYRARDERLDREVAVKVLPEAVSADPERLARFEREAKALARIEHPNILSIHDFGQEGALPGGATPATAYAVTELLTGETLRARLAREQLSWRRAMEIGAAVADGLSAAHAQGVVHRDVKPDNLFLTADGRVKILDFGLAKLVAGTGTADERLTRMPLAHVPKVLLTDPGTAVGTLAYMSPEQALGKDVDARTDLFSLGVVLYEMATGRLPFRGNTSVALIDSLLHEVAPSPASLNPDLPGDLEGIINKALEKDRTLRYQSACDMRKDLQRVRRGYESEGLAVPAATAAARIPSLAVLPFMNLSADKENEYFSDGLAEDIIDALAQLPGLRVMARTSSFAFRGKEQDVRDIGTRLNVEHIVEGSVRRAGSRIRVTAQLVKASDGYHLWSERFDREMTDIFVIQDEISQAIVEKLRVRLTAAGPRVKRAAENMAAYDLCLKARHSIRKMTREGREAGRRYCGQALALDPGCAAAHVVLGESYLWSSYWGEIDPRKAFSRAKSAALEALGLDDSLADPHCILGTVLGAGEFDWAGAEREFARARALNIPLGTVRHDYAWCYAMWFLLPLRRMDEALAEMRRAVECDPLDPFYNGLLGCLLYFGRQLDAGVAQLRHAVDLDPGFFFSYWLLSGAYAAQGRMDEAVAAAERANELSRGHGMTVALLGRFYGSSGRETEARELLEQLLARRRQSYVPATVLAYIYRGLGELEESARWLDRGIEERDPILVTSLQTSPTLDPLRSGHSYEALLRKMNLEPQANDCTLV